MEDTESTSSLEEVKSQDYDLINPSVRIDAWGKGMQPQQVHRQSRNPRMPQHSQSYGDNNQYYQSVLTISLNRTHTVTRVGMRMGTLGAQGAVQGIRSHYRGPPEQFGRSLSVSAWPTRLIGSYSNYPMQHQATPPSQVGMVQGTVWNRTPETQHTMSHSTTHASLQQSNDQHQSRQPEVHREPPCPPPHHPVFTGASLSSMTLENPSHQRPSYLPYRSVNDPKSTHGEERMPSSERIRHMSLWQRRPNVPICRPKRR